MTSRLDRQALCPQQDLNTFIKQANIQILRGLLRTKKCPVCKPLINVRQTVNLTTIY